MKHKKWIAAVTTLLLGISLSAAAFANSAPVYGSEEPTSHVLPLEENGIGVEKELLTFQMREDGSADVIADYTLRELAGEERTVKMAFPFLMRLSNLEELSEISILQDGEPLAYEFCLAGVVEDEENGAWKDFLKDPAPFTQSLKMENILAALEKEEYQPQHYDRAEKLNTYELHYPEGEKEYNIIISMTLDEKDRLIEWGFNGFDLTDKENVELSTWIGRGHGDAQDYGFAVIAGDGPENIAVQVYEKGYKKGRVEVPEISVEKRSRLSAEDIIKEYTGVPGPTENESVNESVKTVCEEYSLRELDRQLSYGQAVIPSWDLNGGMYSDCHVGVLMYEVTLPAEGTVQMTVNYRQRPTWDASSDEGTVYTYAYLVSPAKYFEHFGRFSLQVIPAGDQKYITASNIPFAAQEDGSYLAEQDGLPENELIFSMYKEQSAPVSGGNSAEDSDRMMDLLRIGIIAAAVVLLVMIIVLAVRMRKRKGEDDNRER